MYKLKVHKKLMNLRPFAFAALAMAAGVFFCYAAIYHGIHLGFAFLTLLFPLAAVIFSSRKRLAVFCFFVFLFFLGLGMGGFALQVGAYESQELSAGKYTIAGEVSECTVGDTYTVLLLKDVSVEGEGKADGKVKLYVYVSDYEEETGSIVALNVQLQPAGSAYRYHVFRADMVLKNIRYTATCYETPEKTGYRFRFFAFINGKIKTTLYGNLNEDCAGVAYALTTGNTAEMDEGLLSAARYGGVAHLFAVSGLHVGVVFALFVFLCKKLRMPVWLRTLIPVFACLLFCGICNFTPSSVRALVILSGAYLVKSVLLRADGTELVSIAALLLLCVSPVYLFSAGFILSFSAFIGVAILSPVVTRALKRVGFYPKGGTMPEKILKFFVVMFCVQICLFPAQIALFGYVSVWGILLNCLFLPLFSVFFPLLLVCLALACAIPAAAGVFLFLPSFILQFFVFVFTVADFSSVLICGFSIGLTGMAAYYFCIFLFCGKINVDCTPLCCFLSAFFLAHTLFYGTSISLDCKITQRCYYNDFFCALIETKEADVLLINGEASVTDLRTFLYRHTAKVDAVVVVSESPVACINSIIGLSFGDIYIGMDVETGLRTHTVHTEREFTIGKISFEYIGSDGLCIGYDGITGSFNAPSSKDDFTLFYSERRDGLIFSIKGGILSLS